MAAGKAGWEGSKRWWSTGKLDNRCLGAPNDEKKGNQDLRGKKTGKVHNRKSGFETGGVKVFSMRRGPW